MRGSEELADAMAALSSSFTASETALLSGRLFACAMYGEKDGSRDISCTVIYGTSYLLLTVYSTTGYKYCINAIVL